MKEIFYPTLNERLFKTVLPNGLRVIVVPTPGFSRNIAYFMPNYGAVHPAFTLDGLHYNDIGHGVIAEKLKEFIEAL